MKKSIGWVSNLTSIQQKALEKFISSWLIAEDGHAEFRDSVKSYCIGMKELFLDEHLCSYSKTIEDLRTGMSTFLEGWAACLQSLEK